MSPRPRLSLKARALGWLAQREHSRSELRRKLLRVARQEAALQQARAQQAQAAASSEAGGLPVHGHGQPGAPSIGRPGAAAPPDLAPAMHRRLAPAAATAIAAAAFRPVEVLDGEAHPQADCTDPERCVEQLLDWLQANRYLSEARFVESRVHARVARYGNLRIRQELAQHGVMADAETLQQLRESEFTRAREVWRRKFDQPAADAHERARQMRFLAQRGFSAEVVRRVVQGADDE